MSRKLTLADYNNMPNTMLLGFWLMDQKSKSPINTDPMVEAIAYEKILAAYEAYGREGVSMILAECGYETESPRLNYITLSEVQKLLEDMREQGDHRFFYVEFVKRTDNTVRKMMCRFGVKKHLKGGEAAYDAKEKGLCVVFDPNAAPNYTKQEKADLLEGKIQSKPAGGYRSIPYDNIIRVSIGGHKWVVQDNKDLVSLLGE